MVRGPEVMRGSSRGWTVKLTELKPINVMSTGEEGYVMLIPLKDYMLIPIGICNVKYKV